MPAFFQSCRVFQGNMEKWPVGKIFEISPCRTAVKMNPQNFPFLQRPVPMRVITVNQTYIAWEQFFFGAIYAEKPLSRPGIQQKKAVIAVPIRFIGDIAQKMTNTQRVIKKLRDLSAGCMEKRVEDLETPSMEIGFIIDESFLGMISLQINTDHLL